MLDRSVPEGLCIALFKGTRPGLAGVVNRIGRRLDGGPYSHCEMVFSDGFSVSSSFSAGGVRRQLIKYRSVGFWDFLLIPDPAGEIETSAKIWFGNHMGCLYDIWGNVRFAFGVARHSEERWFCSEACMAALGFEEAFRYGPSGMVKVAQKVFGGRLLVVDAPSRGTAAAVGLGIEVGSRRR